MGDRPAGRRKTSVPWRILKILYWLLFALCVAVLVLYVYVSRPPQPERAGEPPSSPAAADSGQGAPEDASHADGSAPAGRQYKDGCYTFLVLGMDAGGGNTDTIMVVTYDVAGRHVGVVSIPRDTLVDVPRTVKKLNAAYASGGVDGVKREVSDLVGFLPDYHILIDLKGFQALVDALGGVDFDVPVDMDYDDPVQGLHIHLRKGTQHLDGAQALQLARFRSGYANADIGRIETQQKLLAALAKKLLSWNSVTKLNDFAAIFAENVETDLTVRELGYFALSALELELEQDVSMGTLPGDGTVRYKGVSYYYQLYPQQTLELLNQLGMTPYTTPLTPEDLNIFQVN